MKLVNIASLDPAVRATGLTGLKNASSADRTMWDEMQSDWDRFAFESHNALQEVEEIADPVDFATLQAPAEIPIGEDRPTQATVRIGQTFFRSAVLSAYNERCCITGLGIPELLVASHIVPWRVDTSNRTNPRNGLLLSALHDKAFDLGLIAVSDDLTIQVSQQYGTENDAFFVAALKMYEGRPIHRPERFSPDEEFLSYHRENIFQG